MSADGKAQNNYKHTHQWICFRSSRGAQRAHAWCGEACAPCERLRVLYQRIFASAVNALTFLEAKSRPSRPLENEYFGAPAHRGIQRRKGRTGDFELLFTLHPSKKFKADAVLRARAACVTVGDGSAAAAQSASICARTKSSSCIASRCHRGWRAVRARSFGVTPHS